jgi:hypothetical protein
MRVASIKLVAMLRRGDFASVWLVICCHTRAHVASLPTPTLQSSVSSGRMEQSTGRLAVRGFAVVEMLIVITISGTLASLLLAAVQPARGDCITNMNSTTATQSNFAETSRSLGFYIKAAAFNGAGAPPRRLTRRP